MSRRSSHRQLAQPNGHSHPIVQVHDHDVLAGRGVRAADHPGNLRFRALIKSRIDKTNWRDLKTKEKTDRAKWVIDHIQNLNPPGRFLMEGVRRGTWVLATRRQRMKKTTTALRDSNREDRRPYAARVPTPSDVVASTHQMQSPVLSLTQHTPALDARNQAYETGTLQAPSSVYTGSDADKRLPMSFRGISLHSSENAPVYADGRARIADGENTIAGERQLWNNPQGTQILAETSNQPIFPHLSPVQDTMSTPASSTRPVPVTNTPGRKVRSTSVNLGLSDDDHHYLRDQDENQNLTLSLHNLNYSNAASSCDIGNGINLSANRHDYEDPLDVAAANAAAASDTLTPQHQRINSLTLFPNYL